MDRSNPHEYLKTQLDRFSTPYPSFETFEHPRDENITRTNRDDGIRYGSRVTNLKWRGPGWETYTAEHKYRTKNEARDALKIMIAQWFEYDATYFISTFRPDQRPLILHGYTYQNGRYIGNTGDEWADMPAIVGSFDLPHAVFARSYAAKLGSMLQKHFRGRIHLEQAFLFMNIFHMHARKVLQQRVPADAYDIEDELKKYRIIRYRPSNEESQEIWLFSILTYWMIFPEDDYTPASEIMTRAARYGAAVARNLAHVDYEIAMFFNDHLFAILQPFLTKRKKQQQRKAPFPPTSPNTPLRILDIPSRRTSPCEEAARINFINFHRAGK